MRPSFVIGAILVCTLAACHRNVEPYVENEEPRAPDLARIFPDAGAPGGPAPAPGPTEPPGMPAAPGRVANAESGAAIRGTVEIAPDLAAGAPRSATLFVIARRAGAAGGPPLAVRRIASPSLPLDFDIGPEHAMIQGMPFAGPIQLSVRLDGDGDAMTREPGDLSGSTAAPVEPGAEGIRIVLDQRI